MPLSFELVITPEPERRTRDNFGLALHLLEGETSWDVLPACHSLQDFEENIDSLQDKLAAIKEQARWEIENLPSSQEQSGLESVTQDPAQIWTQLEAQPKGEMQDMFNALPEELRRRTAEYVLTQVSMFTAIGSFFAENYNHSSGLLEG